MKRKKSQKKAILYHVVDSLLPAVLVLLGSFTTARDASYESVFIACIASGIVAVNKFYEYWKTEEKEFCTPAFNFITP